MRELEVSVGDRIDVLAVAQDVTNQRRPIASCADGPTWRKARREPRAERGIGQGRRDQWSLDERWRRRIDDRHAVGDTAWAPEQPQASIAPTGSLARSASRSGAATFRRTARLRVYELGNHDPSLNGSPRYDVGQAIGLTSLLLLARSSCRMVGRLPPKGAHSSHLPPNLRLYELRSMSFVMSRPQSITDDEILAAARAVFLDKGIRPRSTRWPPVATSERPPSFDDFPTKQALFLAAMDTTVEPPWLASLEARSGSDDFRAMLIDLASEMVAHGRRIIPLIVMKMSNPAIWQGERAPSRMLPRVVQALTALFALEIDAGRIKAKNPHVAARIWVSSVQQYVMFETLTRTVDPLPVDVFIEGLVDLLVVAESPRPVTTKKASALPASRTSNPAGRK